MNRGKFVQHLDIRSGKYRDFVVWVEYKKLVDNGICMCWGRELDLEFYTGGVNLHSYTHTNRDQIFLEIGSFCALDTRTDRCGD